ncbi:hypothetical protein HYH03_000022 [Edaphochlamys debaryana]|uniref:Uncharacterized protein n=1 Tax=Edaphochlamys debaryana TaxID=47281 RepID=A0A835YN43_9CHLO|nr:hypothetical protein HYH03_000022 [Edaphochlamys debaryana]|eukprot:KAG2501515.1 hypothetical protein HYH03_000022 [Edaphochlamys debaryana]
MLPPSLHTLTLGRLEGLSGLRGAPALTRLDLCDVASPFHVTCITQLGALQSLSVRGADLALHESFSRLQELTQLVTRDLVGRPVQQPAGGAGGAAAAAGAQRSYPLPPRLRELQLMGCEGQMLRCVGGLEGSEHLTRLEVWENSQVESSLPAGPLAGLVGLRELVAPSANLLGPDSLAALTLLRVRHLLLPPRAPVHAAPPGLPQGEGVAADGEDGVEGLGPAPAPPPPPDWELPPNLQLLRLGRHDEAGSAYVYAPDGDVLGYQGAGCLVCAHGPTRLLIDSHVPWAQRADALLGLAGLRELDIPGAPLFLGPSGLTTLSAISSIRAHSFQRNCSNDEEAGAQPPALLPPYLERLVMEYGTEPPPGPAVWAALGRAPPTLQHAEPLPRGFFLELEEHVGDSGELYASVQKYMCPAARFQGSLPEPPTRFRVELLPPPRCGPEPFPIRPSRWQLLPAGSDEAATGGVGGEAPLLPPPSHAPWLSALGGMRLRRLDLKRIRLCAEDLAALATHMPHLEALSLSLCELPAPSSLPLLAGLRRLQELGLDCGGEAQGPTRFTFASLWGKEPPPSPPPHMEPGAACPQCAERGGGALPPGAAEGLLGLCVAAPDTLRRVRLGHWGCGRSGPALALGAVVREMQQRREAEGLGGVGLEVVARGLVGQAPWEVDGVLIERS